MGEVTLRTSGKVRPLWVALVLILGFMAVEVGGAVVTGSLALLADAGHMVADAGAIGAAIWAISLARRPPARHWSYGLPRAEIVAAAGNGVTLLVVAGLVLQTAIRRLVHPPAVAGLGVVEVACAGIVVNLAATWVLRNADMASLNVEGVVRHVATDLAAFVATAIAGGIVDVTGFDRADPIASLLVVIIMVHSSWELLAASGRILLEGAPESVNVVEVRDHILQMPEVLAVHDLHAWTLTSDLPVLSAHVVVSDECWATGQAGPLLDRLQECLQGHFDLGHSTFQLEPASHVGHEEGVHD